MVVKDDHLLHRFVLARRGDDLGQPVGLVPEQRRVVERVGDRGRGGKQIEQPVTGAGVELGEAQAGLFGLIGGNAGITARAGEDGQTGSRDPGLLEGFADGAVGKHFGAEEFRIEAARARFRFGQDTGDFQEFMRIGRPGGTGILDQGAEDLLVAGDRSGVGGGGSLAGGRAADLEHGDADLAFGAVGQPVGQLRPVAVGLLEEGHGPDPFEAGDRLEPVAGVEHRLVSGRDDRVETQVALRADRVHRDVAGLGDHRHPAGGETGREGVAPEWRPVTEADHPVAVRAAKGEVRRGRDFLQLGFELLAGRRLAETGRDHDRPAATGFDRLPDRADHSRGGHRDHDRIDRSGQVE